MAHNATTGRPLAPPHDDAAAGARQQTDPAPMDRALLDATIATLPPEGRDLLDFLSLWMHKCVLLQWEEKAEEEARQRAAEDNDTTTERSTL